VTGPDSSGKAQKLLQSVTGDGWPKDCPEDLKEIRRRQLAEVLSHQGKIELDIDLARLSELRSLR